jgi:hypothetical protein
VFSGDAVGGCHQRRSIFCGCSLLSVLYHFPRSLILPVS